MGDVAGTANDQVFLVKGPVNTALYDLRREQVYSINPLMVEILDGVLDRDRSCKPPTDVGARHVVRLQEGRAGIPSGRPLSISKEVLQVLRGYLTRHPALAGLHDGWNKEWSSKKAIQTLSFQSGPVGLDFMWLELTNSCNLSCTHCYAEAGTNYPHPCEGFATPLPSRLGRVCEQAPGSPQATRERESISLEHWKGILSGGARLGAKSVQFVGGEPTLYPGLVDLIEHARFCQYRDIEVFTNATRLEDRLLQQLVTLGVKVALSFYSYNPEIHDTITGRPGSFQQTVQGIKAILAYKIPVRVAIVLMRDNLSHLKDTVEFLKGLGLEAREIEWDYVRPTGRGVAEVALMGEEVAPFKPSLPEEGQGACGQRFAQGTCWKGKITISSEGEVYPCIFARQLPVGKLPEMGLEEVIHGQALQRLWQITLEEVETCRDCELRYGCFDCRALAQTTTGDLLSRNPHCRYNPYTGIMERSAKTDLPKARNGGQRMKERPRKRQDIVNEFIEDESVIYDPKNHHVHHLNPMASVIWEYCDGNHTAKEITEEIVSVLGADPVQVEGDVTKTLKDFQGKDLLEGVLK